MAKIATKEEYLKDLLEDKVTDYKNPLCINCNECCCGTATISKEEYDRLEKYFSEDKEGQIIHQQGVDRILSHLEKGTIYLICPLSDENKKCTIYDKRPQICKEFHCGNMQKFDKNKFNSNLCIINLFMEF